MTMSMRVDRDREGSRQYECTVKPRTPSTWIPDARVRRCFGCNTAFTTLRRKHHCRGCGRIFCNACTSYRMSIPTFWLTYAPSPAIPESKQRMCGRCVKNIRLVVDVEWLVKSISVMPVTFSDLYILRLLDKTWNRAVNTLFSFFRGLQYKLPCQPYSEIECNFLWAHYKEFARHVPWQIHTLVSLCQGNNLDKMLPLNKPTSYYSCRQLLCSRACHAVMSMDDIIRLGTTGAMANSNIRDWVIASWKLMDPTAFGKMMCWWVYLACKYKKLFSKGLLPICSNNLELLYSLWFECELQKNDNTKGLLSKVQKSLVSNTSQDVRRALQKSIMFVKLLDFLAEVGLQVQHIKNFFQKYTSVRLPWNPKIMIVDITRTRRFNSSSKPIGLTCQTDNGQELEILVKNEDVRTDRLAMIIGYWINHIAKNVYVHTYNVFPISEKVGCVEMIQHAQTLYDIRKTDTLLNFVMSNNETATVGELRERIVASCAGACLLAFTMGLGDRHLENILITADGLLAHVDFGYVLGEDPKHIATPMRITDDMVEAMGGKLSKTFQSFVLRTQKGYEAMRLYAPFWYHLLVSEWFIHAAKNRHWKRIRDHVLDRFVPGEWDTQAALHIQTVVQRAVDSSWLQRAADFTHAASNGFDNLFHLEL
jgi:hypothetical protein